MTNPYAPPGDFDEAGDRRLERVGRSAQFYGVSISTLVALHLVTFGLYAIYWFYRHWSVQKYARGLKIYPILRGIFAIFFVHQLFKTIDFGAREAGLAPKWNANSQATIYVMLVLVARVIGRLADDPTGLLVVSLGLSALSIVPLVAAQRVANLANGSPSRD